MAVPLLDAKLHVPRGRRGLVARPRLSQRLSRSDESALTLVSAPAGFGKTTLVADWLTAEAGEGRSVAWLSLDPRDNDPVLFWTYLVAALRTAVPGVGDGALMLLQSAQAPTEEVLSSLLNDLQAVSTHVVLVLDDYHVIDAPQVQDGMAFLVEHLPPQIHLVLAGRADPALPLARLRARGELVEIRAADLRFAPDEVAAYLNGSMGLALTDLDVTALEGRTEGWIAALQLAALSMQGRDDISAFIAGFAGDDRFIVDYLTEEVLARQPDQVRTFLLQTSILSRLSGSLCDAVTGQGGGQVMLEALDRGNLFVVPLDDRRWWYRYHHLFADVLGARLLAEQPDRLRELHLRASHWFERNGEPSEAIHHAMVGEDPGRAAELIEHAIPAMRQGRQEATLRRWLEALPEELIEVRPVLGLGYAAALMGMGEFEGVEARLRQAERWLDTPLGLGDEPHPRSVDMVVADEEAFLGVPSAIAMYRAGLALIAGDSTSTIRHARRALDLVREGDHVGRGAPAGLLGLAYWRSGDLAAAHLWFADSMASLERAGHLADVISGALPLADIEIAQGRLREAMSTYRQGLERATAQPGPPLRGAADMHVGMSLLLLEGNDLDAARAHLLASRALGEHAGLPQNRHREPLAWALLRQAEGDPHGALALLDDAERLLAPGFSPDVRSISALRARLWVTQGSVDEALGWARLRGLRVEDDLAYLREYEHITLAQILVARSDAPGSADSLDQATRLLERLLPAAEEGGRTGSVIEILVQQALAHQARGDLSGAQEPLTRAVTLSEPEGYVRVFVDQGPPLASLLRAVAKDGTASGRARSLLAAFTGTERKSPGGQRLVEPLSARELDVLRLLGSDLSGPEIARELYVSLNTLRTHTKSIYAKLGVTNRRAAVRRAGELDLISRTGDGRA